MNTADACLPSAASCWYADLDAPDAPHAFAALSADECNRAGRLRFGRDRLRFLRAHAALREVLGERTGMPPAALRFVTGAFGKPALADRPGLQFSLSHSHAMALIAVGSQGPVGIDIEQLRAVPDALVLAASHFTPGEAAALAALPEAERIEAFLICWTRKEACVKAVGLGLVVPPECFEVGIAPTRMTVALPTPDGVVQLALGPVASRPGSVASLAECLPGQAALPTHFASMESFA